MTSLTLRQIVNHALAQVGVSFDQARVPHDKARATAWLPGENGFGIRHYASGRQVYVAQTRMGGRLRTVTIGPASVLTRQQAMTVARQVIAHARVGHDPATARQQVRNAPRIDAFIREYWAKCSPRWKATTLEIAIGYRQTHIDGAFPEAYVDSLTEAEVAKWFARITDNGGPSAANSCLDIMRAAFNKAEAWGYREENTNPFRAIRPNRRVHRRRFLSELELARLGKILACYREEDHYYASVAAVAITLLLLTGCRVSEVLGLHWDDVKGRRLLLRDSKTGPRTVWLGDEAREVIKTLPRYRNVPWLFWNSCLRKPITNIYRPWDTIRSEARLRDVHLHDLRHTFASHAAMGRESLPMIGKLLGHSQVKSTARYAHLDDAHLLDAAEAIGAVIEQAMAGRPW